MSSPRSVSRHVRCGVRDLASCFYACRFPLAADSGNFYRKRHYWKPKRNITFFEFKGGSKSREAVNKEIPVAKSFTQKSGHNNTTSSVKEEGEQKKAEPCFADEDYIVFSFREDGAIDMIISEDKTSSEEFDENDDECDSDYENANYEAARNNTFIRPIINRKQGQLFYGEHNGHGYREDSINGDDGKYSIIDVKVVKKPSNDSEKINTNDDVEQESDQKTDSFESCDSNVSDKSTSSFAFPVLRPEWIGSPVHMPKAQEYEPRSVCLHCCRSLK